MQFIITIIWFHASEILRKKLCVRITVIFARKLNYIEFS